MKDYISNDRIIIEFPTDVRRQAVQFESEGTNLWYAGIAIHASSSARC